VYMEGQTRANEETLQSELPMFMFLFLRLCFMSIYEWVGMISTTTREDFNGLTFLLALNKLLLPRWHELLVRSV
jgi:hypothetical protein